MSTRPFGATGDEPKKTAESTGRLPPTPILHTAAREHNAIESGDAPAATANTPVIKSVRLKANLRARSQINFMRGKKEAYLRPQTSDPMPQKTAPTSKPMFCPSLRKGPLKANSLTTGVRISPVTIFKFQNRYSDHIKKRKCDLQARDYRYSNVRTQVSGKKIVNEE
jgi:hypothetical protein